MCFHLIVATGGLAVTRDAVERTRVRERAHFDELWGRSTATLRLDDRWTFRDSITPAHIPGGSQGGFIHLRAYELLMAEALVGKNVLDYACGLGKWSVHLAQLGANVAGFDLSDVAITHARKRAAFNDLDVRFDTADAANLPYADASFDVVVGIQALHHTIKYGGTAEELYRVMRPGAVAVFTENLGHNRALQLARWFSMRRARGAGDVILTESRVRQWGAEFSEIEVEPYCLFSMAKRVAPGKHSLIAMLHRADEALLARLPQLRRYCGECVIFLRK
jgi:ubiquinone/menaquinone biosynthesis C-methylase UbiE